MEQTLQLLIKLQEIDSRLLVLEKMKGSLPDEVAQLKTQLAEKKTQLKAEEAQLDQTQSDKRRFEMEMQTLEEQLVKYKEQIYSVKTNKEYDAITAEVETTEIEISDIETQILELIESEEGLQPQIENDKKEVDETENQVALKEQELEKLLEQSENEVKELSGQRTELTQQIRKPILAAYERINRGKGGLAVVKIDNGVCTGCFSNLPPQTIMEIKKMDQLINCQYCGRFLIYVNDNNTNDTEEK